MLYNIDLCNIIISLFLVSIFFSLFFNELMNSTFAQEDTVKMRFRVILLMTHPEAQEIIQKLKAGTDFSELARQYSIGPSKEEGGDVGYFAPGEMMEELNAIAINLKVGNLQLLRNFEQKW